MDVQGLPLVIMKCAFSYEYIVQGQLKFMCLTEQV